MSQSQLYPNVSTLNGLKSLSPTDAKELAEMISVLKTIKTEEIPDIVAAISTFPPALLFKYATDKTFNDFCERVEFNDAWAEALKKRDYPAEVMECVNPKIKSVTLFSRLKGAYLYSNIPKQESRESYLMLNEACELGIYQALVKKLLLLNKKIADSRDSKAEVAELPEAEQTAERMSQLYWTLGYINASNSYLTIADYQANKLTPEEKQSLQTALTAPHFTWQKEFNNPDLPAYIKSLKKAAISFYMAFLLESFPTSMKLIDAIYEGRNLFEGLPYNNRDEGVQMLGKKIEGLGVTNSKIFLAEALKEARALFMNYRPDVFKQIDKEKLNHPPHK